MINNIINLSAHRLQQNRRQTGLSLVELMVAIVIGSFVLLGLSSIFLSSNRASVEMRKSTQQQENGRYASQLLYDDLMLAGYLAEFDATPLTSPDDLPDICTTDMAELLTALPLHVQGVNDAVATPSCLTDLKAGTDIIVVRRASTCVAGSAGCAAFLANAPHFQASLCTPTDGTATELAFLANTNAEYATQHFAFDNTLTSFTRRRTSCGTTMADIHRYLVHIYFVANNNEDGDGIPTLKRAEIGATGFSIVPLVDGIENMQVQYGVDISSDGVPDSYTSVPASVEDWRNTMGARVHLLARNTVTTPGYSDTSAYVLGDVNIAAPGDAYKRHVYSTAVQFVNPSWRRQ
ncbi:MAG: PilW family protein [Methylotenera sp.]|nr:PilW family protein [Methylotenera sp.]